MSLILTSKSLSSSLLDYLSSVVRLALKEIHLLVKVVDYCIYGDPNSVLRFAFVEFTDEVFGNRSRLELLKPDGRVPEQPGNKDRQKERKHEDIGMNEKAIAPD
ncbi:hypothetical protein ACFE04_027396 [Oxalis oulophora]